MSIEDTFVLKEKGAINLEARVLEPLKTLLSSSWFGEGLREVAGSDQGTTTSPFSFPAQQQCSQHDIEIAKQMKETATTVLKCISIFRNALVTSRMWFFSSFLLPCRGEIKKSPYFTKLKNNNIDHFGKFQVKDTQCLKQVSHLGGLFLSQGRRKFPSFTSSPGCLSFIENLFLKSCKSRNEAEFFAV